jgi:hypothetical protein
MQTKQQTDRHNPDCTKHNSQKVLEVYAAADRM